MPSEELQCHVGICDDRASLLPDCLADDARALDVASLAFAHSEDVSDALDAVHVARCVVCCLAASAEGFLYGLVDYLGELCYGEVDDASVLVHFDLNLFVWPPGAVSNRPVLICSLFSLSTAEVSPADPGVFGGAEAPHRLLMFLNLPGLTAG